MGVQSFEPLKSDWQVTGRSPCNSPQRKRVQVTERVRIDRSPKLKGSMSGGTKSWGKKNRRKNAKNIYCCYVVLALGQGYGWEFNLFSH